MSFMENAVAIIGPQSSVIAHVVSYLAKRLQVPLLSFAATDPSLSSPEYPFFVRTTQNDVFQMAVIADIVVYFGWRKVTAIYKDDDFGRNGIAALEDKLAGKQCTISYKAPMNPEPSGEDIRQILYQLWPKGASAGSFSTMLDSGYVWIATDWLTDILETDSPLSSSSLSDVQGLLTLRFHTPESKLKKQVMTRWRNLIRREYTDGLFGLNTYGLHAYDTVWILAHALNEYFSQGGSISFSNTSMIRQFKDSNLHLDAMRVFDGGELLLSNYDSDRDLINPSYDIVNVVGTGHINIGYWINSSGLSVQPPEALFSTPLNQTGFRQQLYSVI
ncbi:glutamate receptor 3.6-like [Silene latifolia]|uniref:glutamate receptor 3.6-like n=1 Tax=Silene latifolia TaxID=37657 RepID=UPI003D76F94B